jgi:diguanylate cyclase (GGDEF)-like protein
MKTLFASWNTILKSESLQDFVVALAWAIFAGLPLFTLHMLVLDYEHYLHGMRLQFSLGMSLKNMIPYHPMSIALWLAAVFITAFSLRRAFRKQREFLAMKGMLKRSQVEADIDELTGVLNRRAFDRQFKSSLEYARLENQPLAVAMIDVDGLKSLNDQYGHTTGYEALRSIADYLTRFVRACDFLARYGGDEFVILCPGLSREDARGIVNRLRNSVLPMGLELSIGVAAYPSDSRNAAEIIELADKLMYREKERHHARLNSSSLIND